MGAVQCLCFANPRPCIPPALTCWTPLTFRRWTQDENGALQILSAVRVGAPQANGSSHIANGSSHIANGSSSHVGGSSSQLAAPQAVEMARKDD